MKTRTEKKIAVRKIQKKAFVELMGGDFVKALRLADLGLSILPEDFHLNFNRGVIKLEQRNFLESEEIFKGFYKSYPTNPNVIFNLILTLFRFTRKQTDMIEFCNHSNLSLLTLSDQ